MRPYSLFALPLSFLLLILISGCPPSGGGGGGSNCPDDVSGTYTFITDELNGTCTDCSTINLPPHSQLVQVTQDDNWITITDVNPDPPSSGTIIYQTHMQGALESDCDFVTYRTVHTVYDDIPGTMIENFTLVGTFTDGGWYGEFIGSLSNSEEPGSCDYSTDFHGDKSSNSSLYNEQGLDGYDTEALEDDELISPEEMLGRLFGY